MHRVSPCLIVWCGGLAVVLPVWGWPLHPPPVVLCLGPFHAHVHARFPASPSTPAAAAIAAQRETVVEEAMQLWISWYCVIG